MFIYYWILLLNKLFHLYESKCIALDSAKQGDCILCASGYFKNEPFKLDRNLKTSSPTFWMSECKARVADVKSFEFFVANLTCELENECLGTETSPFGSLGKALIHIEQITRNITSSNIKLIFIGDTHYIFDSDFDLNSSNIQLFRNTPISLDISARNEARLIIKTSKFSFYIANKLTIKNITFDGSDMNLPTTDTCRNLRKICCLDFIADNPNCKRVKIGAIGANIGLFNLEYATEIGEELPILEISQCQFQNFIITDRTLTPYTSLVSFENGLPGVVNISYTNFFRIFFTNGIISSTITKMPSFYVIDSASGAVALAQNLLEIKINVSNCNFVQWNSTIVKEAIGSLIYSNFFSFTAALLKFDFSLNIIEGNEHNIDSFMSFNNILGIESSNESIAIFGNQFIGNNFKSYFQIIKHRFVLISSNRYSNNSMGSLLLLRSSTALLEKEILWSNLFESTSLIIIDTAIIYLISIFMEKVAPMTRGSYLLTSTTGLQTSKEDIINNYEPDYFAYTYDCVLMSDVNINNSDMLIIKTLEIIFRIEIYNSMFVNLQPNDDLSFFAFAVEKHFIIKDSLFSSLLNKNNFIEATYTKNLTFYASILIDSQFFNGFDYFVITRINQERNKIIANVSNSLFKRIHLRPYKGGSIRFFFFHPYSREFGFHKMLIINVTLEDIVGLQGTADDFLVFTASQIFLMENSFISNIGFLSIQRFFPRVPDLSAFTIDKTVYKLTKYPVYLIVISTVDYYPNEVAITESQFDANYNITANNAISFLNIQRFRLLRSVLKNIFSTFGNAVTVKVDYLDWLLIDNCTFLNNGGSNGVPADLMVQVTNPSYENFPFDAAVTTNIIGLRNTVFRGSVLTGSVGLVKNSPFLIYNCLFSNTSGILDGGAIKTMAGVAVLISSCEFSYIYSKGKGGSIFAFKSRMYIINVTVYDSNAENFGGFLASQESYVIIEGTLVKKIMSQNHGGALWADQSMIIITKTLLEDCKSAEKGGHFFIKESTLNINESQLLRGLASTSNSLHAIESVINYFIVTIKNCFGISDKGQANIEIVGKPNNIRSIFDSVLCENNSANSGSFLYSQDTDLLIINCHIIGNKDYYEYTIKFSLNYEKADIKIENCVFSYNIANYGIIKSTETNIYIVKSTLIDNIVGVYYAQLVKSQGVIIQCNFIFSVNGAKEPILLLIEETADFKLLNSTLDGYGFASLVKFEICDNIFMENNNFLRGNGDHGAALICMSSTGEIKNSIIKYSSTSGEGGGLTAWQSGLLIENVEFFFNYAKNEGADAFIYARLIANRSIIINRCSFNSFNSSSIKISVDIPLFIKNCTFKNTESNVQIHLVKYAFSIQVAKTVSIQYTNLINCSVRSYITSTNEDTGLINITISACYFEDFNLMKRNFGFDRSNGVFISVLGKTVVLITDCQFLYGYTESSGGGISFECITTECQLNITGETIFQECSAAQLGEYIYSPFTLPFIGENVPLPTGVSKPAIYTKPDNFMIFQNKSIDQLKLFISTRSRSELTSWETETNKTITLKSGEPVTFSAILIDRHWNILASHSEGKVIVNSQSKDQQSILIIEPCNIKQGLCYFRDVKLIASPNKLYNYSFEYKYNGTVFNTSLHFFVKYCEKGEILVNKACFSCREGYYYSLTNDSTGYCEKCPKYAYCPGGEKLIPITGFYRANENSKLILKCSIYSACPYQTNWSLAKPDDKLEFTCSKGFFGHVCKMCEIGYGVYRNGCFPCGEDTNQIIFLSMKIFFALVLISWEVHSFMTNRQTSQKTIMRILVAHTNYVTAVSGADLQLSEEFKAIFDLMNSDVSVVPADIFDFHCQLKDLVNQHNLFLANTALKTFCIIFYSLMAYVLKSLLDIFLSLKDKKPPFKLIRETYQQTIPLIFLVCYRNMYPRILLASLSTLKCKDIGMGDGEYLDSNPNVKCWGREHLALLLGIFLPGIFLWSAVVPLTIFRFLKAKEHLLKLRDGLMIDESSSGDRRTVTRVKNVFKTKLINLVETPKSAASPGSPQLLEQMKTKSTVQYNNLRNENSIIKVPINLEGLLKKEPSFLFITVHFKSSKMNWVFVDHIAMFLVILISQVSYHLNDTIKKMIFFTYFSLLFILLQKHSPYVIKSSMWLAYASLMIILLTISAEMIGNTEGVSPRLVFLSKYFIISVNIMFYAVIGVMIFRVLYKEGKEDLIEIFQKLRKYRKFIK